MQYEILVDVERHVAERHRVTVEAESREEALDVAWEVVSDPDTELKVERCLRERYNIINSEVQAAEVAEEGLVQDGVFDA